MSSLKTFGYVAVCLGAMCNGSFSVPLKLCRKKSPGLPDPIFQFYWSLAVGTISVLTIPIQCSVFEGPCFEWEISGIAGALAAALATTCTFIGIRNLGVALPPSFYAGTFIAASAVEDLGFLGKKVASPGMFGLAVALIFGAVLGVASVKIWSHKQHTHADENQAADAMVDKGTDVEAASPKEEHKSQNLVLGVVASLAVGVFGSLCPFSSIKGGVAPFAFVASFGIAIPLVHLVLCPLLFLSGTYNGTISLKGEGWGTRAAVPYALFSGLLWGLGNIGMSFALNSGVDFALASSIYQCGLLVSGAWGVFLFKEMTQLVPVLLFFFCGFVLIGGIAVESMAVV